MTIDVSDDLIRGKGCTGIRPNLNIPGGTVAREKKKGNGSHQGLPKGNQSRMIKADPIVYFGGN